MDFKKLIEPYSENGRTVEAQRMWMETKGIPENIIDHVLIEVYKEIEEGRTFTDGHELDHELLGRAKVHVIEEKEQLTKRLEVRAAKLESKFKPPGGKWAKIIKVMKGEL
jgi:hypothetical protein